MKAERADAELARSLQEQIQVEAEGETDAPEVLSTTQTLSQMKYELRSRGVSEDEIRKCTERSDIETLLASSKVIWVYIDSYVYASTDGCTSCGNAWACLSAGERVRARAHTHARICTRHVHKLTRTPNCARARTHTHTHNNDTGGKKGKGASACQ